LEIANIRNATNIPRSHRISNSKIGNMLEVELTVAFLIFAISNAKSSVMLPFS
jgi:hypothetical protein